MTFHRSAFVLAVGLVLAACGSGDGDRVTTASEPGDNGIVAEAADDPPAIAAGSLSTGTVVIDGREVEYVTSVPDDFAVGAVAPVLLALPPGGQTLAIARRLVAQTYAPEASRLGWVVISPAAPDGELFFNGGEAVLPGFVDWIETWVTMEGGAPHVAGVSNGGISTFRYAAGQPDRVRSIVTFPGFARSDDDRAAIAELTEVPIRMFVGENDTGWVESGRATADAAAAAGVDVELTVVADEGHILDVTADGTVIFELLESFR